MQKRHGRILYDKNALLEEQFKRRIKDMEEERKAAVRKSQEMFAAEKKATYNPRLVNSWLQNIDGVNGTVKYPAENYQNGYVNASMPNGSVLRHGHLTISVKRNDELASDLAKAKSRAESYHHSYNRHDQMASHRDNWDLVRQRSQSTDALPRRKYGKEIDNQTYRSAKDVRDSYGRNMYPDTFQEYHDAISTYKNNEHRYDNQETDNRDRRYNDYERSPRRNYDTYETVVTERDARESDYDLHRNRDESRFRYHREEPRKPVYDNTPDEENRKRNDKVRRSGTKDLNEEIDRILKERNTEDWPGTRIKEDVDERTFQEKERTERRELQKLWAINDAFQKDLETRHPDVKEPENKPHALKQTTDDNKEIEPTVNDAKQQDKEMKRETFKEMEKDSRSAGAKSKSTKESKDTKRSRFKFDNRIYVDSSKHKSKKKDSKKAKRIASKTSASTRMTQETGETLQNGGEPVQDGRTDATATSTGTSSTMKRFDSQIERKYRQFDKYTSSDVYPVTPELSATQEDFEENGDAEETATKRAKENSVSGSENKDNSQRLSKMIALDNKSEDTFQSGRVKSLKSISSRPTVDSRTVQIHNKEGNGSMKTFSVLAGDVGMMEQYQNMSGKIGNSNQPSVKVA